MDAVSQVQLTNGSGYVVYEVADANPSILESAQFPTFIAISSVTAAATASETVTFAPVSTVATASTTAPVPRFAATTPSNDCSLVGDCGANYYPKLTATTVGLNLTATAGGFSNNAYIAVDNTAGGTLNWSANVLYNQGSGWLTLAPSSGQNNGTIMVNANTKGLAAGNYTATITVDGGPMAGSASFPVTLDGECRGHRDWDYDWIWNGIRNRDGHGAGDHWECRDGVLGSQRREFRFGAASGGVADDADGFEPGAARTSR